MSTVDDLVNAAFDRVRASLIEGLDTALAACAADVRRAVLDEHARRQADLDHSAEARQVEIVDLEGRLGAARHAEELARGALEAAAQRSEALERDSAGQRARIDDLQERLDVANQEREGTGTRVADLERALEAAGRSLQRASQLTAVLQALDGARSLGEVFDELTRGVQGEADRAAVFLVTEERVRGWRSFGFDPAVDVVVRSDLRPDEAGLISEAAQADETREYVPGNGGSLPSFAAANGLHRALAVPVAVGGLVVAVLYADRALADSPCETRWREAIQGMAGHAGRVLEALTVRRAAALLGSRGDQPAGGMT